MRLQYTLVLSFLLFCCDSKDHVNRGWKEINTDAFEIKVPGNWEYIEDKGIDSFVGRFIIVSKNNYDTLSFDLSEMGYANHLVPTEEKCIEDHQWMPHHLFLEPGVYYTTGNVEERKKQKCGKRG